MRVIQIDIDIAIDDDKIYGDVENKIWSAVSRAGIDVLGMDFAADMTESYKNYGTIKQEQ